MLLKKWGPCGFGAVNIRARARMGIWLLPESEFIIIKVETGTAYILFIHNEMNYQGEKRGLIRAS